MRRFPNAAFAAVVALVAAVTLGVASTRHGARQAAAAVVAEPADPPRDRAAEVRARDADIALFERRIAEDPSSAADRALVAARYLRRARETGNFTDVNRAEDEAERSLALREAHNEATWSVLASARMAQHDFVGALAAAQARVADDPDDAGAKALEGEILLELGRYDEASARFSEVEHAPTSLSLAPRLARWYEVTGHLDHAVLMARNTLRLAKRNDGLSDEQRAWFLMRVGDLEAKRGRGDVADSLYLAALEVNPGDYRLLAARARLAAQRGAWRDAIAAGETAITAQLEPGTLGVLRDAWLAVGDSAQGASYAAAMMTSALTQPGAIHRAWGLHLVEHGERLGDVLARVRRELQTRHDVYGYDLEAWTLHTMGRDREAAQSMTRALRVGTEDALLWYHAGIISASTGEYQAARDYLARALALNPTFGVKQVAAARARLATMPDESPSSVAVATPRSVR